MKKLLTTLLLLLTYSAVFDQDIDQARWHLEQALEIQETEIPVVISAAYSGTNTVDITWEPFSAEGVDLEFYAPGLHEEWQHSVNRYVHLHNNPVDPESGRYRIGGSLANTHNLEWRIRMRVSHQLSDIVILKLQTDVNPDDPRDPPKFYGYWDHSYGPDNGKGFVDFVNVGRAASANRKDIEKIIDQGIKVIPSIGGFSKDDTEHQIRRRISWRLDLFKKHANDIAYVILNDEPFGKGITTEQMEIALDEAHKVEGVKFGYTFMRGSILHPDREIPKNIDVVGINFYPFYDSIDGYPQIHTKKEFMDYFSLVLEKAREKAPGKKFFITGQAFYFPDGSKWRKPPDESPSWYLEAISKEADVEGLLWFEWRNRSRWQGTESMPEHYERQKEVFGRYINVGQD